MDSDGVFKGIRSRWKMFGGQRTMMVYNIDSVLKTTTAVRALWRVKRAGCRRRKSAVETTMVVAATRKASTEALTTAIVVNQLCPLAEGVEYMRLGVV